MVDNINIEKTDKKSVQSAKTAAYPLTVRACVCAVMLVVVLMGFIWITLSVYSFSLRITEVTEYERNLIHEYEIGVDNFMANALDGIYSVRKVYMIPESVTVMPEPDPECFGQAKQPEELAEVIRTAEQYGLIDADEVVFPGEDLTILNGSQIRYYLDETLLTISWRSEINGNVFNFTEAVLSHPSQFRKYITNNEYASTVRKTVSSMSQELNAVVGMSADFYGFRGFGIMVYNGQLYRKNELNLDTCFVDTSGNLILMPRNTVANSELNDYIKENNVSFSLSFGPIIIDNGEISSFAYEDYRVGEVKDNYSRAAIGQIGELHYLLCTVDGGTESGGMYRGGTTVKVLAQQMHRMRCEKAYTLDGGQTATMTVNGEIFNRVGYGSERPVSDIIFFATAKPGDYE